MRLRRVAAIVRGVGWTLAGVIFVVAAVAAFIVDVDQALPIFAVLAATSIAVLAITYALAWMIDRRGDRLVTR